MPLTPAHGMESRPSPRPPAASKRSARRPGSARALGRSQTFDDRWDMTGATRELSLMRYERTLAKLGPDELARHAARNGVDQAGCEKAIWALEYTETCYFSRRFKLSRSAAAFPESSAT